MILAVCPDGDYLFGDHCVHVLSNSGVSTQMCAAKVDSRIQPVSTYKPAGRPLFAEGAYLFGIEVNAILFLQFKLTFAWNEQAPMAETDEIASYDTDGNFKCRALASPDESLNSLHDCSQGIAMCYTQC